MLFSEIVDRLRKKSPEQQKSTKQESVKPGVSLWKGEIPVPDTVDAIRKAYVHKDDLIQLKLAQENLRNAVHVEVGCGGGIGDGVMSIRYARLIAEAFPAKQVELLANKALRGCQYIALPKNCFFSSDGKASPREDGRVHINLYSIRDIGLMSKVLESHPTYTEHDFSSIAHLQELGINVKKSDIEQSILKFPKELLKKTPIEFDFMLAPDAKEVEVSNSERSVKSFSLSEWDAILTHVPSGSKIAILMGNAHPLYCEQMYALAKKHAASGGFSVERIETATLTDVIEQVLRAKTFIGMDSGTTHLAYEVAVAAKDAGRMMYIKELFNNSLFPETRYALRGLSSQVQVLLYTHRTPPNPDDVSQFLFGKEKGQGVFEKAS